MVVSWPYSGGGETIPPRCAEAHGGAGSSVRPHAGYARFAHNWALGEFRAGLGVGEWLTHQLLRPRWNRVKGMIAPWGTELSQNSAKYAIIDFGAAAESWGEYRRRVGQYSTRLGWAIGRHWVYVYDDGRKVAEVTYEVAP